MQFTQVYVDWYNITLIFYTIVIITCYVIAIKFQNVYLSIRSKKISLSYILIFACLLFVKGFGTTGRDLRNGYYYNFIRATSLSEYPDYSVEIGFRIFTVIIRRITDQYFLFIFLMAFITIFPVMNFLNKYKKKLDYPSAILLYTSIFFFTSFSASRIAIAASLSLFAFDSMIEKKPYKALMWIVISSMIHTSTLILIIPYIVSFWRLLDKKIVTIGLSTLFILVVLGRNSLMAILANNERYSIYNSFETINIGMEQFAYYIPLFLVYNIGRKLDNSRYFNNISFVYLSVGLCFGLLGYVIPIFGRFKDVFLPIIIIIPYYLRLVKRRFRSYEVGINICIFIYCMVRFYIYISQYYNLEDLMPYTNIFGWII